MPARLFCRFGELKGTSARIGEEDFTLGRSRETNLPLSTELVSGRHARIRWDAGADAYFLEDLGSTNGTELDGMPVQGAERLGHLHVITLAGEHDLIFQDLAATARRHGGDVEATVDTLDHTQLDEGPAILPAGIASLEESTEIDGAPVRLPSVLAPAKTKPAKPKKGGKELALVVKAGDAVERFPLQEGENLVGRVDEAAVSIDSLEISRRHAVLVVKDGKVTLCDLGSRNKTYVEEEAVKGDREIEPGARLRFGGVKARLVRGEEP